MNLKLTPEKLTAFIAALAETGIVARACAAVDISRYTAYKWRDEHPEFAKAWDAALKIGITALEDEAARRAFLGIDKPLVHQGQMTPMFVRDDEGNLVYDEREVEIEVKGEKKTIMQKVPRMVIDPDTKQPVYQTMKEYSDTLAIFLLKAHNPERFRENVKLDMDVNVSVVERLVSARARIGRSS